MGKLNAFFARLGQVLAGPPDGVDPRPLSSKRVFAATCLVNAVVLSHQGAAPEMVGVWLGAATAVLFGQAMSRT